MAPVWTPKRVTSLGVFVTCPMWVRGSSLWVRQGYSDDLEVSYLDADQNVVSGPDQVGTFDGTHYDISGGSILADSGMLAANDVCGILLHHRDPGETFPFWFAVSSVQWNDVDGFHTWDADDFYGLSEITPTYDTVPPGFFPTMWVPTGYRTSLMRAVFDTSDNQTITAGYPNALSGGPLPINSSWLSSLNASTATSVDGDISPLPDDDEFLHFAEIVAEPPLGDLLIMFGEWRNPNRPYLRQRQSPRANPRVSLNRPSLRARQVIP